MAAENYGFAKIPGGDQRVEDGYLDELIRKYLFSEDMNSFYEDDKLPLLASPEADKWPGEVSLPDFNYNQDCLVPEFLLMENIHSLPERYDDVEPQEELLSILEEIITEDEKKNEGISESPTGHESAESIVKPDKISISNSDSKSISQETQSSAGKRKKPSTNKKGKRPCRSQPIIMKRRAKQRVIEE